jgi:ketosteroid isomerase-like protein
MTQVRNLGISRYGIGVLALVLAVAGIACAPQDQSAELAAMTSGWGDALNAGDIDALAALYADDCVLMPPNSELAKGQAAARASFGEMIDAGLTGGLDTIEVAAAGDIGFHTGTYWLKSADGTIVDRGKYTEAWRKVAGEWKMVNDIWNSDLAPGAGTTTLTITHDVKNGDHWLAAWQGENSRKDDFAQHGVANVRVFQNPEKQKEVSLLVDVTDMEAFQAYLMSEEGAKAKAEDGVIDRGMRVYEEVK